MRHFSILPQKCAIFQDYPKNAPFFKTTPKMLHFSRLIFITAKLEKEYSVTNTIRTTSHTQLVTIKRPPIDHLNVIE